MIEPVTHRLVVKPFDVTEHDEVFAAAKKSGLVFATDKQLIREQEAVDRGTVVALGPTVFRDFGSANPLVIGDEIVYARHGGKRVEDPDTKEVLLVLNDEDVVAIIRKEAKNG